MNQLKKLGAIGGAISLALCWPLAVGQIGHNVIHDGVKKLNNASLKAEIVKYERGYLTSQVETHFTVIDPELIQQLKTDGLPTDFTVKSDVEHGVISLSAHSVLEGEQEIPLTLDTQTQLNGNTQFELNLDTWHFTSGGENPVTVSTTPAYLKGHATVLGLGGYTLDVPSVELDFASGGKMTLTDVKGEGDGKQQEGFWLGDQTIQVGNLMLTENDDTAKFELKQASYHFNSSEDVQQKRLNSVHQLKAQQVVMPDGNVNDFNVDFALGDLDSVSFLKLMNLYRNSPQLTDSDIQQAIPYIETLFSKGFYLSMNQMKMTLGSGEFESQWKLNVPEGTNNVSKNPALIVPALTGHLNTFFSNELVAEYPFIRESIDEAIVMEMITQSDKGYTINAELINGNVVFENGHQVPLMALLLPMMMQKR